MAKEWVLNMATNRWGLNKKNSVGPVSKWIRESDPKSIHDWEQAYFRKLSTFLEHKNLKLSPQQYLEHLGEKLYIKITEVIQAEIEEITEKDCKDYIQNLVINRTYDGYKTEITTIYGELQNILNVKINPAPDKWDRLYNVDFFIQIGKKYIGLQIKPITYEQTPEIYKWKEWLGKTHEKFQTQFGGKVFIIFSIKVNGKKKIYNKEIINDIISEIERLKE